MHEGYGLTETSPDGRRSTTWTSRSGPGTVGRPLWGVDVEIADAETSTTASCCCRAGELGEIVVRGHNLFKGYLGNPDATAAAVVDGWFRTGDLGTKDADDVVTIVDRKKDMIVRNGYNVYPTEVEDVHDAAPAPSRSPRCSASPDEARGQEVHAAVVAPRRATTSTPEELVAFAPRAASPRTSTRASCTSSTRCPLGAQRQGAQARARGAVLADARRTPDGPEARSPRGGPGLLRARGRQAVGMPSPSSATASPV